jgi:vacuolar-type H+-ATPase subunit E/Vma4
MSNTNVNNVDQIRDIIFGSQIKDFEEKFAKLENSMHMMESSIKKAFNEAHTKLQRETERSLEALEKKIDNLSNSTQRERAKLKDLIDTTDETLQMQLSDQKDEFTTKLRILKENVSDEQNKLVENMNSMKREIENLLKNNLDRLSDDKLSRDSMAQMLLEVAMKIKGTDMNQMLNTEDKKSAKQ